MVTKLSSFTWPRNIIRYLCCLQNFIFLESAQYIKSYGHLKVCFQHHTLDHFIKPRSILKQLCMWLVEVVNANKQLSVSKKFCFK